MAWKGDLRMTLMGVTGGGKSTLANGITNSQIFPVSGGSMSKTKVCQLGTTIRNGYAVGVVDTPGYFDTCVDFPILEGRLIDFLDKTSPGAHVMVYVLQAGRYTKQDVEGFSIYLKMFGEAILPFTVLVFTQARCTEEQFMKDLHPDLKSIVQKCNSRYVFLPPVDKTIEMEDKINQLFRISGDMVAKNNNRYYTNSMYHAQQCTVRNALENQRRQREEEKRREQDRVRAAENARMEARRRELAEQARIAQQEQRDRERKQREAASEAEAQRKKIKQIEEEAQKKREQEADLERRRRHKHKPLIRIGGLKLF